MRSLVADEGVTSHRLMDELVNRTIDYTLAIKANSKLRKFESWIKRWNRLGEHHRSGYAPQEAR